MIRKFITRLLGKTAPPTPTPTPTPTLGRREQIGADRHGIDPALLDERAVRVVRTLQEAGHEAYIVGGAVRDLLVGRRPKDFDVATDATPEQVKALFRRAFIIGRRFRIVHVVFGRGREHEVVEVSTFRALIDTESADQVAGNERQSRGELAGMKQAVDASGRVLRDNVWGPQVEDAARRDFTVNAMYYDPVSAVLVDYHGGLADVRSRLLRMIGDPAARYREDPVRLLRVARFAAKLGFSIEPRTLAPMSALVPLLANVPGSRLFDEMIKLLQTGHAIQSLQVLHQHGLIKGVFPVLEAAVAPAAGTERRDRFVRLALEDTDRRVNEGRAVAPSFLIACLLWHEVHTRWQALREAGEAPHPALQQAMDAVFQARVGDISGRGKLAADMREIWSMQPRFERRTLASCPALVAQPRFRAGYDFLRLRADAQEAPAELADWWEDFSMGTEEEREALLQELKAAQTRRVPARRAAAGAGVSADVSAGAAAGLSAASASTEEGEEPAQAEIGDGVSPSQPARRRRRRRRRGGARSADEAGAAQEGPS